MRLIVLKTIRLYQKTISPDHGFFCKVNPYSGCRFYPSCSEYMYQSISKNGLKSGMWAGLKRLARCNPWSEGGYDPVKHNNL